MAVISGGKIIELSRPGVRGNPLGGGYAGMGPFYSPGLPASGFLNAVAPPGAIVVRVDTGEAYQNTGTLAATTWASIGSLV